MTVSQFGNSGKFGKCSNFGNCSIADARTSAEVATGQDFVCTECGKPLLPTGDSVNKPSNTKAIAVGALLLVLLLAAGGVAWSLLAGKKPPTPAAAFELPTPPKAEPVAQPPATGNCSAADERTGLCRRAGQ